MTFWRRLIRLFFPPRLDALEREAGEYGRITLTQTGIEHEGKGVLGWQAMIRAHERNETDGHLERHPQFSWKGEGVTMAEALEDALSQAREMGPTTRRILGDEFAPRLSGKTFD